MKIFKNKLSAGQREALKRLADGIECGAKLRPQGFSALFHVTSEPGVIASCALGAALECKMIEQGVEVKPESLGETIDTSYSAILKQYGVTTQAQIIDVELNECEPVAFESDNIYDVIIRLNDSRRWSREQIAAFLREVY